MLIFAASIAKAQEPKRYAQHNLACYGWSFNPFADQKSKTTNLEPLEIDGVEVRVKSHKLSEEHIVFIEYCDPKDQSKPIIEGGQYGRYGGSVREFRSYEVNGRIFAISFTYDVILAKDGYILERAGAAVNIYYIDEDGDGVFKKYQGAKPLRFLPDWVKVFAVKS